MKEAPDVENPERPEISGIDELSRALRFADGAALMDDACRLSRPQPTIQPGTLAGRERLTRRAISRPEVNDQVFPARCSHSRGAVAPNGKVGWLIRGPTG